MELAILISSTFLIFVVLTCLCGLIYWSAKNGWSGMTFWYGFLLFIFLGAIEDNVFPDLPKTELEQKVDNN